MHVCHCAKNKAALKPYSVSELGSGPMARPPPLPSFVHAAALHRSMEYSSIHPLVPPACPPTPLLPACPPIVSVMGIRPLAAVCHAWSARDFLRPCSLQISLACEAARHVWQRFRGAVLMRHVPTDRETHMQNIKDITSNIHYEVYRVRRLNETNTQTNGVSEHEHENDVSSHEM
ncbi:hypothetical protein JZ751_026820 [Albula glossodonta]|uniref:Uncharacterized protein n=1 Tax=Albula glossodonta TaxID=121402 RepID=A0A8T2PM13_9TELE|nr:hypothetical protein JZ751_026820 [Albula glossodonta]